MSQKLSPAEHVSLDYLTVVICCMWWTWLYYSVYLLQVVDWTPKEHCGGGEPDLGTVELLRERRAKLCEIRLWEEMSGQRLILHVPPVIQSLWDEFPQSFLFCSDFITTYMPLGFPSFLPCLRRPFLSFRYSFLRLFPSDALFSSFILLSTFLSFFLLTQPFPILPRFLSRAVKRT